MTQSTIYKLIRVYSDLSIDWLLTGNGQMFQKPPLELGLICVIDSTEYRSLDGGGCLVITPLIASREYESCKGNWLKSEYLRSLPNYVIFVSSMEPRRGCSFEILDHSMDDGSKNAMQRRYIYGIER